MSARTQTLPSGTFEPRSGSGRTTEVKKSLGEAIDAGLRMIASGVGNAQVAYSVEPLADGSFQIFVKKVVGKAPAVTPRVTVRKSSKPKAAATDLETALAAATRRGEVRVAEILAGDDMASADEFAASLGITRQSLHAKLGKHQVFGLEGVKRGVKFPTWQLGTDGKPFAALPALAEALDGPWAVYRFLTQYQPELDMTGLEALRQGRDDDAIALARNLERSGA